MKFIVDRKTWLRGCGEGVLLDSDGMQCCVGQFCTQLGVDHKTIIGASVVDDAVVGSNTEDFSKLVGILVGETSKDLPWLSDAYDFNDDEAIYDTEREAGLINLLAENGHELEFIN